MIREAIVYIPTAEPVAAHWRDLCAAHCAELGYRIISFVSRWDDVITELAEHRTAVVVTGRHDMIGRIEALTDPRKPISAALRRPQRMGVR